MWLCVADDPCKATAAKGVNPLPDIIGCDCMGGLVKRDFAFWGIQIDQIIEASGRSRFPLLVDGIGSFNGTLKKTYKNTPVMVADSDEISIEEEDDALVDGKPATSEVSVYFRDEKLMLGTDYTVKYSNNKAVASAEDAKAPRLPLRSRATSRASWLKNSTLPDFHGS